MKVVTNPLYAMLAIISTAGGLTVMLAGAAADATADQSNSSSVRIHSPSGNKTAGFHGSIAVAGLEG